MYILKNAIKNIWRNKGRNILLGVIILGIIIAAVVTFSIRDTTEEVIKNYKEKFGSEVTIIPDMEKILENAGGNNKVKPIDSEQYFDFGNSKYLKEYIFTSELGVNLKSGKALDEDVNKGNEIISAGIDENGNYIEMKPPKMKLSATSNIESLGEFKNGVREIIEGEIYKDKDQCVVSEDFAKLNNLKVGDFLDINRTIDENKVYKLKITGIFRDSTDPYGNLPFREPYMNRRNEILTNLDTAKEISGKGIYIQAKYFLKNPDMIDEFEKELRAKGLSDGYKVNTDKASYNEIVGPVEGLGYITLMFLFVVLILGAGILILLNNLAIRERKYEIGVLRAIGMKKNKVATGLIIESMVVTVLCLVIGTTVGNFIAEPVSNSLLQKQIEVQKEISSSENKGFMVITGNQEDSKKTEVITKIDITLNGKVLMSVIVVALLIVLLSSIIGIMYITKYEPRKILTERG